MSGKEQFIKLPRDVLESAAFGSLGINGFRVLRFLMIEHMRRGGRQNGQLKAPHRQLVACGIGTHQLTAAIAEVEERGLVECQRHGLRVATTYALTWLPFHDGSPATNAWRSYQPPPKPKNLPVNKRAGLPVKQQADRSNLPVNQQAEPGRNLPVNQQALYRSSYQGGDLSKEVADRGTVGLEVAGAVGGEAPQAETDPGPTSGKPLDPTRRCGRYVVNGTGHRVCGRPSVIGTDRCPEHAQQAVKVA